MNDSNIVADREKIELSLDSANLIKENIDFLMRRNSIHNRTQLANLLNIKVQTLYSFLNNPLSASAVKKKICDYFFISQDDLETKHLSEILSNDDILYEENILDTSETSSIVSMSNNELLEILENSNSSSPQIQELKSSLRKSYLPGFNSFISLAKRDFYSGNYQKALLSACAAFYIITPQDISAITKEDFKLYISIAKKFSDNEFSSGLINKLTNVILSEDYYDERIAIVMASLLEKDFPISAQVCYETIINKKSL